MKKGLLLTAFLTTLILDMGVGPVLIVFGAMNLSKQTSYPSAAWLMVRGIVNCVQFIIVMLFTYIVSKTKGQYSRKEETLLIARLLGTHPLAYFYYLLILFGIVWNILGSCWIAAAFRHYSVGFASCYLVGVILAWISVIASPLFVFSGGLSYGTFKKSVFNDEPNTIQLVAYENDATSITNILNNLHNDGISITVEDILYMSKQKEFRVSQPMITLKEEEKPVVVDNIAPTPAGEESMSLMDSLENGRPTRGVVVFQKDVLDDEKPTVRSVQPIQLELLQAVEVREDVAVVQREAASPVVIEVECSQTVESEPPRSHSVSQSVSQSPNQSTNQPTNQPTNHPPKQKEKKEKKEKKNNSANPKEHVVIADEAISLPSLRTTDVNLDDEYVDVSIQMRDAMNRGDFDHVPENKNIFTTSFSNL